MNIVYAKNQFSTSRSNGLIVRVLAGEPWDAESEIVKAHPEAFSEVPVRVRRDDGWVETATAVPGERRKSGRGKGSQ